MRRASRRGAKGGRGWGNDRANEKRLLSGRKKRAGGERSGEGVGVMTEQPKSAYFLVENKAAAIRKTFAVLVDNEAGVLARVIGLFAGRGYNIESLTVAEVDHLDHTSRITIVTSG